MVFITMRTTIRLFVAHLWMANTPMGSSSLLVTITLETSIWGSDMAMEWNSRNLMKISTHSILEATSEINRMGLERRCVHNFITKESGEQDSDMATVSRRPQSTPTEVDSRRTNTMEKE